MEIERKKIINQFYTELYQMHLAYCDLDNNASDAEEQWSKFIGHCDDLARQMRTNGTCPLDERIFRRMMGALMAIIQKESVQRAQRKL